MEVWVSYRMPNGTTGGAVYQEKDVAAVMARWVAKGWEVAVEPLPASHKLRLSVAK